MSIIQPVHVRYGYESGDTGQDIPTLDPAVGGEGLKINFTEDLSDSHGHHSNAGGISLINGPGDAQGFDVWGTVTLWLADLWAPDANNRTEFQVWASLCEVLVNGDSGATLWQGPHVESWAPIQHDDLLWDSSGNVVKDAPGHRRCNYHYEWAIQPIHVPANRRLRVHVAQFHDSPTIDGKPYPGHVLRAWADLLAVPR